MKSLIVALIMIFFSVGLRAEEAATTEAADSKPAVAEGSAKKKAMSAKKKKSAKKPVEKTTIAAPAPKEEHKTTMNQSLQDWLAKMKKRVSAARSKQNKLVAVAAVRGDEKTDPAPLYWKGKEGEKAVDGTEIDEFNAAVESASSGDVAGAKVKLQQFIDAHPKSPLVADAKETMDKLSTTEPEPQSPDPIAP
jgi:TolA-binding protein